MWTEPLALVSETEGREIIGKLNALEAEYRRDRALLADKFKALARLATPSRSRHWPRAFSP
jgi:hypothetical protein